MVRNLGLVLLGVWLAVVTGAPLLHLVDHALGHEHDHIHVGSAIIWLDDDSVRAVPPDPESPGQEAPGGDVPPPDDENAHSHDAMLGANLLPAAPYLPTFEPSVARLPGVLGLEGRVPPAYRNASAFARGPPR